MSENYCVVDFEKSGPLFESTDFYECYDFLCLHQDDYDDLVILFGREDIYWLTNLYDKQT